MDNSVVLNEIQKTTDELLMRQYQYGDLIAFKQLYLRYEKRIYNFLVKYTGNIQSADDLFQDVFFKVHKARDSYEDCFPFAPWIFTIAVNTVRNEYKKKYLWKKLLVLHQSDKWDTDERLPYSGSDLDSNPAEILEEKEISDEIQRALCELPDSQRQVIILNKYLGFSYAEIAQMTDSTMGSVKQKSYRGFSTLKKLLRDIL